MIDPEGQGEVDLLVSQIVPDTPLVCTVKEFVQHVFDEDAPKQEGGWPLGLKLGVEKFRRPGDRHYRLIWIGRGKASLAAEDEQCYPTKTKVVAAVRELAASLGVVFDERTR